jgi:hypothetical protein
MRRLLLPLLLLLPALGGCYPWAVKGQHTLKLTAPETVAPGAIYTFHVDVLDASGQTIPHAHYGWMIDWPEVRGITHTGISAEPQMMTVKGGPGKALLRLYAQDEKGRWTQVDTFDFKVE